MDLACNDPNLNCIYSPENTIRRNKLLLCKKKVFHVVTIMNVIII